MKKILCLIDSIGAGGAQRQIVGLATFLKEMGYKVEVAIYNDDLFYANELEKLNVKYHYLKKAQNTKTRLFHIAHFIRCENPDWVISYLDTPNICSCFAKLFNRRFHLIVSERNTTQNTGVKERIRFNMYRIADVVVPNSYSQANYIKNTFGFLSEKIVTIPNFVDLKMFTPTEKQIRKEIPEIMIAASIWASKNALGFIDAVELLRRKGFQFHVSWYGLNKTWVDYIQQCQTKINNLGLTKYIELKEKTTKIRDCYQKSDYFCLPSFYEGTPNVICEAMASGLPIACSDVCDNSRYVEDGDNGFLFDPKNADSIVRALERLLLLNDDEYESYCRRSREKAEKKLSKNTFVNSYIELIEK